MFRIIYPGSRVRLVLTPNDIPAKLPTQTYYAHPWNLAYKLVRLFCCWLGALAWYVPDIRVQNGPCRRHTWYPAGPVWGAQARKGSGWRSISTKLGYQAGPGWKVLRVCSFGCTDTPGIFGGRTEFTDLSGAGIEIVPNLPECRVPVLKSYRTYGSVGYRYWSRTELI